MAINPVVIANILSSFTVLSCLFLKVPQIISLRQTKSAEGIFIQAVLMEIAGMTTMTLYSFTNQYSLMTYLEYPIILVQVYVMLYYVLKYKGKLSESLVPKCTFLYFGTVGMFAVGVLPKTILSYMVPFCTPLTGFSKATYIYGIIKTGNADAVSLTTWVISALTNSTRIYTVYVDSCDTKLLTNFVVSTMLSTGVLLTAYAYQRKSASQHTHKD